MNKLYACGLGLVLSIGTVAGQPAPAPAPAPTPAPTPAPKPQPDVGPDLGSPGTKTNEKAGTDESLQNGGNERPWARGVSMAEQARTTVK